MVAELRWILLGLSVLLLAGIGWWGARRSRQAPGNAELREPTDTQSMSQPPRPRESEPALYRGNDSEPRDWGVSPFEPLSIRTADFEHVQVLDMPMMADAAPTAELSSRVAVADVEQGVAHEVPASEPDVAIEPAGEPPGEFDKPYAGREPDNRPTAGGDPTDRSSSTHEVPAPEPGKSSAGNEPADRSTGTHEVPNVSETQRIVSIRVCANGEGRWGGAELMVALEAHGLAFGRYKIFHRKHSDGRTLFCAASLVEPGTFDIAQMPHQDFRGLTLFAVLPGPGEPVQTVDALIATATELADNLQGVVQDAKGTPLSPASAEALREDVARFQALLTMT